MRSFKLASLILLAGSYSVACNDGGEGTGTDGGQSVGAQPGTGGGTVGDGDGTTTGGGVGDGDGDGNTGDGDGNTGDGDGDGVGNPACDNTEVANAMSSVVDTFDHDGFPNLDDGSVAAIGTWEHSYWDHDADGMVGAQQPTQGGEEGAGYLEASCDGSVDAPWCAVAFSEETPWAQWASIDLVITPYSETEINCFDAGAFTGIKFKAKSAAAGNSVRLQINTPDADADTGETYQSDEIPLGTEWEEFSIPFSDIKQPGWSSIKTPLDPTALRSVSWVVRTREDQEDGEGMVVGETLSPYNVQLDDVEFY